MRHVVLYIPDFSLGGAERVGINLAECLPTADLRVTLLVNRRDGPLAELVPACVRIVSLDAGRTLAALPGLARFLRRERPDVLIASLSFNNLVAIWANMLSLRPARIVVSFHNTLSREAGRPRLRHRLLPMLYALSLPWADHVVAVSQGVADDLAASVRWRPAIGVIHNPIVSRRLMEEADAPLDHPWFGDPAVPVILGVGRLVPQKNFALLIDAFACLRRLRPARLAILGDGALRRELTARIDALGLGGDAALLPSDPNPWRYMKRAAVVALTSHYEGFGNVLVEAMAAGVPVVSTDCPHGPAEILGNGTWGILVRSPTPESFAQAMLKTLDRPIAVDRLRARATAFSTLVIADAYRALIARVCAGRPERRVWLPENAVDASPDR